MNSGVPEISWWGVGLSLLPILLAGWFYHRWCGGARDLGLATVRMIVQLLGVGFLLVILFDNPSWWIAVLVVTVMVSASAWIGLRAVQKSGPRVFGVMAFALLLAGLPVLVLDLAIIQGGDLTDC
jgi:putative ABC transport system permease protein